MERIRIEVDYKGFKIIGITKNVSHSEIKSVKSFLTSVAKDEFEYVELKGKNGDIHYLGKEIIRNSIFILKKL